MSRVRAAVLGAGLGVLAALPWAPPAVADVVAVATVPGAHDIAADHRGTVYVTDPAHDRLLAVRDGAPVVFAGQIAGPAGLAVDGHDNVYVGTSHGRVLRFAPDGTRSIFAVGRGAVLAVTADAAGDVYWADADTVWKAAPDGRAGRFAQVPHAAALATDRSGNLFVATGTEVVRLTPAGASSRVVAAGARSLTADADDTLYAGGGDCAVRRYRPSSYAPDGLLPGICAASLFAAAPGVVYYTAARTGAIARIAPAAPPAPSAVTVTTSPTSTTITLAGGGPGQRYESSLDGGATWTPAHGTGSVTVTGLRPGRHYAILLRAVNATGPSAASAPIAADTPAAAEAADGLGTAASREAGLLVGVALLAAVTGTLAHRRRASP